MNIDPVKALEFEVKGNQSAWAKANKISPAYVSDVIAGRREPGKKILSALGLERVVSYRFKAPPRPKPTHSGER